MYTQMMQNQPYVQYDQFGFGRPFFFRPFFFPPFFFGFPFHRPFYWW